MRRNRFEASIDKRRAVNAAEAEGKIVARITSGEITLAQGQAELAAIKRDAKKNGLTTRSSAFNNG